MSGLASHAAALLGGTLRHAEALGGGDLSQVVRLTLADGRQVIAKSGPAPRMEAAMLHALSAAGAPAPAVLAVDDRALVLQMLPAAGQLGGAWASLGAVLARLHASTGDRYGWDGDYAFGPVAIGNAWCDGWPEFWAARRLMPHLDHLPAALARRMEALARNCPQLLPARPKAALLHGDLWGGNVLVSDGSVSGLIDPACYYGDAEVDIAMLGLFDRPGRDFFDAYGGLAPGAEARLSIYRLWPVLVHVRLFGAAYFATADALLSAVGY